MESSCLLLRGLCSGFYLCFIVFKEAGKGEPGWKGEACIVKTAPLKFLFYLPQRAWDSCGLCFHFRSTQQRVQGDAETFSRLSD